MMDGNGIEITIWYYDDAPEKYKALTDDLDDIELVMFVRDYPDEYRGLVLLDSLRPHIGPCRTQEYRVEGGTVTIGWHA